MDNNSRRERGNGEGLASQNIPFQNYQIQVECSATSDVAASAAAPSESTRLQAGHSSYHQLRSTTAQQGGPFMTTNELLFLARDLSGLTAATGLGVGSFVGPSTSTAAPWMQQLEELHNEQQEQQKRQHISNKAAVKISKAEKLESAEANSKSIGVAFRRTDTDSNSSGRDPDSSGQIAESSETGDPQHAQVILPSAQPISSLSSNSNSNSDSSEVVFLPCRARGMPVDHNFRSAHFRIPPNIKHGEHLVCSYPQCRREGVKFRFCVSCQIPVASRNFCQRHSHRSNDEKKKPKTFIGVSTEKRKRRKRSNNNISSHFGPQAIAQPPKNDRAKASYGPSRMTLSDDDPRDRFTLSSLKSVEATRELRWSSLLGSRPDSNDADGMSFWLSEVMAVSDPKIPVDAPLSSSLTGSLSEYSTDSRDETSSVTSSDFSVKIADSYASEDDCSDYNYGPSRQKRRERDRLRRKRLKGEEEIKYKEDRRAELERKESSKKRNTMMRGPLKKRRRSMDNDKIRSNVNVETPKEGSKK